MSVKSTRAKGNRSVNRAIKHYEEKGWLIDKVEKTGKWIFEKDLFGLFDLAAIKKNKVLFIQVKTNRPPTQKEYINFAKRYAGRSLGVQAYTWYDRRGAVIHKFYATGKVHKDDLR